MTIENYNYRTSQIQLRNQYPGNGKLKIPIIPKFQAVSDDFDDLLLIGFDKTRMDDVKHTNRMVHFFLYDYRFERVWREPDKDVEKLSQYRAVLSPDFSMYIEMAPVMQIYNTFRNRWCGAFWASKGLRVIPTVNWGDESTFDFCFDGIEKGSVVAVSTYMATEHGNHQDQKEWFMAGYNEMLRKIEPEKIICYNTPFPEMQGDIVFVDYERSSWKYQSYENDHCDIFDADAYKIGGTKGLLYDTISPYQIGTKTSKGGGSAYGGRWKPNPNKPEDQRLVGKPGQVNRTGNKETHIGKDGYADYERHNTDHGSPNAHSNPHDHTIDWSEGRPAFGDPINYSDGSVPDFGDVYGGGKSFMDKVFFASAPVGANRFESISDFIWCMKCGGEVQFLWNGVVYSCCGKVSRPGEEKIKMYIAQAGSVEVNSRTEKWCDSADEVLEYMVGADRLRDVITRVTVLERTI